MLSANHLLAWTSSSGSTGSISVDGSGVLAWAYSNVGVDNPSDPESTFQEHTSCKHSSMFLCALLLIVAKVGFFGIDYSQAHTDNYQNYLEGNPGTPPSNPGGPTTTTTSASTGPTTPV